MAAEDVPLGNQLGFREYWASASYSRNQTSLQKYLPLCFQTCVLQQTVREQAWLDAQGKRKVVENYCVAPTTLLRMLPKALFNTDLKRKILKHTPPHTYTHTSITVSNNHNSAG